MKHLSFFVILICAISLQSQTTLVLQPDAATGNDARIFNIGATANYGNDVDLIASQLVYEGEPGTTRSVIGFDLSSIPQTANVLDARLSLYYNAESQTPGQLGNNAAYLRRLIDPWNEGTITWAGQPNYTLENEVLLPESATSTQDYENIDVTALVRDMVQFPNNSNGFMLMLQTEQGMRSIKFYSSDGANPDKHPRLVVIYTTSVANKEIHFREAAVRPNPFKNSILLEELEGSYSVSISDLQGKIFFEKNVISAENGIVIDGLENIPGGIYLLKAIGKSGHYISKIVKAAN